METVLITGGSGLVGSRLSQILLNQGYNVTHLSRTKTPYSNISVYRWDINKNYVEKEAIESADYIIHLAGANVFEKKWTKQRKKEIRDSRVLSANLLFRALQENNKKIKAFISASAIGLYGDRGNEWLDEDQPPATDFLGKVGTEWEGAAQQFMKMDIRTTIIRTGLVLSPAGGILPQLKQPVKFCIAPVLGSGKQFYSWIHIDDLCYIYIESLQKEEWSGTFNAVAPYPVTQKEMIKSIANKMNRPALKMKVPSFFLKLAGEKMGLGLDSARVSAKKVSEKGFLFRYPGLDEALSGLLK